MPIRNPFASRRPPVINDENAPPSTINSKEERSSFASSRASSAMSIGSRREEPAEYKLSVVNDSGVYLPPSPPEKKSFWQRTPTSTTSSNHRSCLNDNEPFSISRESFDSYRRSFDISARSPVHHASGPNTPRQSLDSRLPRHPRPALNGTDLFEPPPPTEEEPIDEGDAPFEDVGLNDDIKPPPKKKGIFSRFGDSSTEQPKDGDVVRPVSGHSRFHLPGRKRGQSGQGAELGNIDKLRKEVEEDGVVR